MEKSKTLIVNLMKCGPDSRVASNRIAFFLRDHFQAPLVDSAKRPELFFQPWDRIFLVNAPYLYCGFKTELESMLRRKHPLTKVYWVSNEYAASTWMPASIRRILGEDGFTCLANHENFRGLSSHRFVNWNLLTYKPMEKTPEHRSETLFYWGALREKRMEKFREYFGAGVPYDVCIAPSSAKAEAEWSALNPAIRFVYPVDLIQCISKFAATVYIKDSTQPPGFAPANRFYEALSAQTLLLIDRECESELEQTGLPLRDFVIADGAVGTQRALGRWRDLQASQQRLWTPQNLASELPAQLAQALL